LQVEALLRVTTSHSQCVTTRYKHCNVHMSPPRRTPSSKSPSPSDTAIPPPLSPMNTSRQLRPRPLPLPGSAGTDDGVAGASAGASSSTRVPSKQKHKEEDGPRKRTRVHGNDDGDGDSTSSARSETYHTRSSTRHTQVIGSSLPRRESTPTPTHAAQPSTSTDTLVASAPAHNPETVSSPSLARLVHSTNIHPHASFSSASTSTQTQFRSRSRSQSQPQSQSRCGPYRPHSASPEIDIATLYSSQPASPPATQPSQYEPSDSSVVSPADSRSTSPPLLTQLQPAAPATSLKREQSPRPPTKSPPPQPQTIPVHAQPLSTYSCPICFCPPTNATLTPCGHIACGSCLFKAVKAGLSRVTWRPEDIENAPKYVILNS